MIVVLREVASTASQSGIFGSSPQRADPAAFARADPARFATEKGERTPAVSVER